MTVSCAGELPDGRRYRSWPIRGEAYCLWHSPDREEEAAEARRLDGLRRRREKAASGAYDLVGLDSVQAIRRILEIATIDTLGLEELDRPLPDPDQRRSRRGQAPRDG